VQLLFIDGRVSASMLPLMLPKFASRGVYSTYIYPVLFGVLKVSCFVGKVCFCLKDGYLPHLA